MGRDRGSGITARPVTVSICGDAGGAAALAPVLAMLEQERAVELVNYAYGVAPSILARSAVPCISLDAGIGIPEAEERLRASRARLLLTGTSVNETELEKPFIAAARHLGCRSVALLDFWSNYRRRFSDASGHLSFVPDVIAVMDERAASDLRCAGIQADVCVTGQPAFDGLAKHRAQFAQHTRASVRRTLGATDRDTLVLFFSQPLDEIYDKSRADHTLGFDQHDVLRLIIGTLKELPRSVSIKLAMRPHPRERRFHLEAASEIDAIVDHTPNPWDSAMSSDLVTGMTSVALLQASHLGCPVLSLQPGLVGEDMLPQAKGGSRASAYSREAGVEMLRDLLTNASSRSELSQRALAAAVDTGATERVRDCVYQQLELTGNFSS